MPKQIEITYGVTAPSFERQLERQGVELFDGERQEYARAFNALQILVAYRYMNEASAVEVCRQIAARVARAVGGVDYV